MRQRRASTCFVTLSSVPGSWPVSKIALMYDVDGKTAVITGAASGMGLGMARSFADAGMKVVLADIDVSRLQTAVDDLKAAGHSQYLKLAIYLLSRDNLDGYNLVHYILMGPEEE